jgi:hypothetical protein
MSYLFTLQETPEATSCLHPSPDAFLAARGRAWELMSRFQMEKTHEAAT